MLHDSSTHDLREIHNVVCNANFPSLTEMSDPYVKGYRPFSCRTFIRLLIW
jgi:hypothetical protein